ncbi:MAG TPA: hypothetical protein VG455_08415, partial [Acidimicrobiales bacterium]|nr:hypothetical protein [Acidimicrobiales bacterium]
LAPGTELLGPFKGSGCVEPPHLVRRPDGGIAEVSPLLHLVAAALDGTRDVAGVAADVSATLGRRLTAENVSYLIERKLRPLGVVADRSPDAARLASEKASPGPMLGLAVRFGVVPQTAVRAVATVLQPLFVPAVIATLVASVAALDAWLLLAHGVPGVPNLLGEPGLLPAVVGMTLLGAAFHELGHATATVYGGAEPGRIGAGVYLLWPVFYNDLNDSYRLSRRGRLRSDLGGVYFNVVFILLLFGAYGGTGFKPIVVAILVQHLVIVQQFLPFVRLDGYYVVSDLAGVPDLFRRIGPTLASFVPGRAPSDAVTALRPGARLVVTAWVLLTVPVLVGSLVLFVVSLPTVASTAGELLRTHLAELDGALPPGGRGRALLSGLQVAFLAFPVIGLSVPLFRGARRLTRSVLRNSRGRNGAGEGDGQRGHHPELDPAALANADADLWAGGEQLDRSDRPAKRGEDAAAGRVVLDALDQLLTEVAQELEVRRLTAHVQPMGE